MDSGIAGTTGRDRLHVAVRQHGASAVVTPAGELDHHTADILRDQLDRCIEAGTVRLVIDCAPLEFCDSTGLNVLLSARLKAEAEGGAVHLVGMQPMVARVLEITGAEAVFTVHETLDQALTE